MADLVVLVVIAIVATAVGLRIGIVVAPRLNRGIDRVPDKDLPASDEEARDRHA